jgi:hypothetical protein
VLPTSFAWTSFREASRYILGRERKKAMKHPRNEHRDTQIM